MPNNDRMTPDVDSYPPLKEWLDVNGHSCMWSTRVGAQVLVEQWLLKNHAIVIIVVRPMQRGWDIFTCADTTDIKATLRDAEIRTGLRS